MFSIFYIAELIGKHSRFANSKLRCVHVMVAVDPDIGITVVNEVVQL